MITKNENHNSANQKVITLITDFVQNYRFEKHTETSWREPVVGFADAADPMFLELKQIIGPNHALPSEILPGAQSVIAYFIPFSEDIINSNIPEEESSREWDYSNIETNILLADLNQFLHEKLAEQGYYSSLLPPTYNYDEEELVSDWSHKSAAYIAGIGKFGAHHLLITDKGCCGRIGSIITDMKLTPTPRPEKEYCLNKYNGSCRKCVSRCVNHAFCVSGNNIIYDRHKCNEQIYDKIVPLYPIGTGDTCGKCMCGVPCSFVNPCKNSHLMSDLL